MIDYCILKSNLVRKIDEEAIINIPFLWYVTHIHINSEWIRKEKEYVSDN